MYTHGHVSPLDDLAVALFLADEMKGIFKLRAYSRNIRAHIPGVVSYFSRTVDSKQYFRRAQINEQEVIIFWERETA